MATDPNRENYDLRFTQGDRVSRTLIFKNFTNGATTWSAQIRRQQNESSAVIAEFDCSASQEGDDTKVVLELAAVDNTLAGSYYWDIEATNGSDVQTYLGGKVTIAKQVTN